MINYYSFSKRSVTPEGEEKTFYGSRVLVLCGTVGNVESGVEVEAKASQPEQDSAHANKGCYLEPPQSPQKG